MNLYRERDVISEIITGRAGWLGHVERRPEERTMMKVFKNTQRGKRSAGKPRKRW
jgi:hypothetical protein